MEEEREGKEGSSSVYATAAGGTGEEVGVGSGEVPWVFEMVGVGVRVRVVVMGRIGHEHNTD